LVLCGLGAGDMPDLMKFLASSDFWLMAPMDQQA
jgi:hypothetical protein